MYYQFLNTFNFKRCELTFLQAAVGWAEGSSHLISTFNSSLNLSLFPRLFHRIQIWSLTLNNISESNFQHERHKILDIFSFPPRRWPRRCQQRLVPDCGSARGRGRCWRKRPGRAMAAASSSSGSSRSASESSWTWQRSGSSTSPSLPPSPCAHARRWEGWMLLSALTWQNEFYGKEQIWQWVLIVILTFLILQRRKRGQPLLSDFQNHGLISSRPELGGSWNKAIVWLWQVEQGCQTQNHWVVDGQRVACSISGRSDL